MTDSRPTSHNATTGRGGVGRRHLVADGEGQGGDGGNQDGTMDPGLAVRCHRAGEEVGVPVAGQEDELEEHHCRVPHGGRPTEQRQHHLGDQRLDPEQ